MVKRYMAATVLLVMSFMGWADLSDDLFEAAENGNLVEIENQLEQGVDVNTKNENGSTALIY